MNIIFTGPSGRGWHRLQQAAECLQKYAWTYGTGEDGKSPLADEDEDGKSSPALIKGSLVHLSLAHHYARMRQRQIGEDENLFVEPKEAVELIAKLQNGEKFVDEVMLTYEKYVNHYDNDEISFKVVGVERLFETQIRGKYLLTGRMDLVFEDHSGRIWVMDHKTTSKIQSSHKEVYAASGQLIGYQHLARTAYGDRLAGLKLNLIEHGGRKFERLTLPRSPFFESQFEQTVVDIEENIQRLRDSGRPADEWPKAMNEMSCYGRYGACKFLDKCRWGMQSSKAGNWTWNDTP